MDFFEIKTLETTCFEVIINNFDLLCNAFHSTEKFKLHLPDLQKQWGNKILEALCKDNLLKKEHLQIVLHEYLTELDIGVLQCDDKETVLQLLAEVGHVIRKVSVCMRIDIDQVWNYFPNVHSVNFSGIFSNHILHAVCKNCPHLRNLNFHANMFVDDRALMTLINSKLPLERLDLQRTQVSILGVARVLQKIPSLKELWFEYIEEAALSALEFREDVKMLNLNNLSFCRQRHEAEDLTSSIEKLQSACPYVNDLTVFELSNERQLTLCSSFSELKNVHFSCKPSVLSINNFLNLKGDKIHSLSLQNFSLSLEILLNNCPNLKKLTLNSPHFDCNPLGSSDLKLSLVKYLEISDFGEENAQSIASLISACPNLEDLKFSKCRLTSKVVDAILHSSEHFKLLEFQLTSVEVSMLKEVLRLHKDLKLLVILNCGVTADQYSDLKNIVARMKGTVSIAWYNIEYRNGRMVIYD